MKLTKTDYFHVLMQFKRLRKIFFFASVALIPALSKAQAPIVDSARFNDATQKIVTIYFSEPISLSDLTGFTINIGAASYTQLNNPFMVIADLAGNKLDILLFDPFDNNAYIKYDDVQLGITVDYDGSGDLRASDDNTPVNPFSGLAAINNVIIDCSMLAAAQQIGTAYSDGPCQQVNIQLYLEWNFLPVARNSIYFNPTGIFAIVFWRDLNDTRPAYQLSESSVGSGKFTTVTPLFSYPEEDVCVFSPTTFPRMVARGAQPEQPDITCGGGVNQQDYVIPAYRLDNEELDGILSITPPIGSDPTLFCVGEDIGGFVFDDATSFNCNVSVELDRPNEGQRWMKFVYGTHTTPGIPNVYIDVYGTMVQITDANGDYIPGPFTVDPATGASVAPYTTRSGFFESELFVVPEPCTAPIASTYPIYHTGNFATDEADDVFGVTLQNWGPCNRYSPIAAVSADPIEEYDELRLIPAPPPPLVPSPTECEDAVTPTITATGTGGVIDWYDISDLSNNVYTGTAYTHGETTPGTYIYWLTETRSTGGPTVCTSDTSRSTLTINPLPNKPTIALSGPASFCYNGGTSDVTLSASVVQPPIIVSYQWYRDGNPILGETGSSITLSDPSESGTYTVSTIGISPTDCEGPQSDPQLITIYPRATTTNPSPLSICEDDYSTNGEASFTVTTGGAASTIQWLRRVNSSSPWNLISGPTSPNDGAVYSGFTSDQLDISSVDYSMNGYQYRVRVTTIAGGCQTYSDPATLTVHPAPTVSNQPDNLAICETTGLGDFDVAGTVATGSIAGYEWRYNTTTTIDGALHGSIYSGFNTATLTVDGPDLSLDGGQYRAILTSDQGCDVISDNAALTVDPLAVITSQPTDQSACDGSTATFQVTAAASPVVTGYQWQVQAGGAGPWVNVAGAEYSGANSNTLDIDPAPLAFNTNNYRVILTTNGPCTVTSDEVTLTVNANPTASISQVPAGNLCYNDIVTLDATVAGGSGPYIHAWSGDVTPLDATDVEDPDFTAPSVGSLSTYDITYTVQDGNTCQGTDNITVTVYPEVQTAVLTGDAAVCSGFTSEAFVNITGGVGPYTVILDDLVGGAGSVTVNNYDSGDPITLGPHTAPTNTYTIQDVIDANGCSVTTPSGSATVVVGSVPTAAVLSGGAEICDGATQDLAVTVTGGAPPYTLEFDVLPDEVGYTNGDPISTGVLAVGAYDFNLESVTDACGASISGAPAITGNPQQIIVRPIPVISYTNNAPTICNDGTTDIDLGTSVSGTIFTWTVDDGGGITWTGGKAPADGTITDAAGTETISQNLAHTETSFVPVDYIITSEGPGTSACPGNSVTATTIVEPTPAAAISNNTQVICNGAALTGMTVSSAATHDGTPQFDMVIVATTGDLGDLTGTLTALTPVSNQTYPYNINGTITNNSSDPITIEYRVTPELPGCISGTQVVAEVTIEPTPEAAISNNTQTLCDGAPLTAMNVTSLTTHDGTPVFDMVITATVGDLSDLSATGNALDDATDQTYPYTISGNITNNTDDPITIRYRVTPQLPTCSDGTPVDAFITIEPTPKAAITNNTQVVCDNEAITGMDISSVANHVGVETFDMSVTALSGNLGDLTVTSGNLLTPVNDGAYTYTVNGAAINGGTEPVVIEYRVTPKLASCSDGTDVVATITIEPKPAAAISNNLQTVCDGAAITGMTVSPTTTHNGTPQFDLVITALSGDLADLSTSGNALSNVSDQGYPYIISGDLVNSTTSPIVIEYRVTPELPTCTDGDDVVATITVEPTPEAAISNNPQVLCNGGTLTTMEVTSAASPNGAETFDLNIVATTGNLGDLTGTGTALATPSDQAYPYDITGTLTNGTDDLIVIEYRVTPKLASCANGPAEIAEVSIEPTPRAAISNNNQTLCDGGNLTAMEVTSLTTHDGTPLFNLTIVATTGDIADLSTSGNALTDVSNQAFPYTISGDLLNATNAPIVLEYRVVPTLATCTDGPQVVATVTVNPSADVNDLTATICDDGTFTVTPVNGTDGVIPAGTLYSWGLPVVSGGITGGAAGTAQASISGTLSNPTNAVHTATYTVTPVSGICVGATFEVTVTVNPTPDIADQTETVCSGTGFSVTPVNGADGIVPGGTTYTWSAPTVSGGITGGAGGTDQASIGGTLINPTNTDHTATYTVTPTSGTCTGDDFTVTVTVKPTPDINDLTATICDDGTFSVSPANIIDGIVPAATTYSWPAPIVTGGITGGAPGTDQASISGTLSNPVFTIETATYTVTPTAGTCTGPDFNVTVTVNPTPNVTATAPTGPPYTILNGETTNITVDGDVAGSTFTWIVLNPGSTNATDGGPINQGDKIAQTLDNNGAVPVTITYRIYSSANGCDGDSLDFDVTIDPSVDITVTNNAPYLCTGESTDIDVSSLVSNATFTWTVTDPSGLGANAQPVPTGPNTGITIQDPLTNISTVTDSVIYHIMATGPAPTFATSAIQDVKVYVYPKPQALPVNNADSICDGSATDIYLDSDVAGTTFSWTVTDPSGVSGAAGGGPQSIGYTIAQTLDNPPPSHLPVTVEYRITPTGPGFGNCPGDPVNVEVVIDPTPVLDLTNNTPEICSEEFTDIVLSSTVANSEFTWLMADPKATGATGGTGIMGESIQQQLFNVTQSPVNINYEVQVNGPGTTACPGAADFVPVQVDPLPNTTPITGTDTVCEQTPNLVFSTDPESGSTFEWFLPPALGTRNFGGTGFESNAIVFTAADIPGPAYVTDSVWVFEENIYGCTNDTLWKPLTIIPYPVPTLIAGDDEVCAQSTHTYSVPDNPGSTYQWFLPVGAGFETDPTLNEVTVTFGLISGNIRVTETTAGGCVTNHTNLYITVRQLPVTTLNVDKPVICDGETVTFTAGPTTDIANYEFFINGTSVQSSASNTFVSSIMAMDDTVTVNATSIYGCERLSPDVIMTVNPDPVVTLASSAPANTICANEPVTFEATSADAVLYNFFLNGVSRQAGPLYFWDAAPGTITDGDSVYVEVQNSSGCWGASDTIETTVNPLPVASIDGDYTICPGETRNIAVTVTTGTGPYDVTIDNGVPQQVDYVSGTNIPVSPMNSTIYSLTEITDFLGCTSTLGPNLTGAAEITVRDTAQILTQPTNIEVCEGVDTSFSVSAIGDALNYQWQVSDDLSAWTNLGTAAVQDIITPDATDDGDYYRVVLTSTCNIIVSDTVQLTIRYNPISARDPINDTICEGSPTGFGVDAGATENPAFQWFLSTDDGSSWAPLQDTAAYTGSNSDSLRISSAASRFDGYQYYVEISGDCGGFMPSNPATLFINERPEILVQPADTTVCESVPALFFVDAGVTSNPVFQWQVDMRDGFSYQDIGIDSVGVYEGYNNDTLRVLSPESRFDQYRYRVRVSGTCTPAQTSSYATLTVNEEPEIVTQPVSKEICEEQSTIFTVNAGVTTGATFTWEVDDGNGFLTIGGDTAIYSGTASNTLFLTAVPSSYDGYQYRVTVGGICPGTVPSDIVDLTVNDVPEILADPVNDTVCENDAATFTVNFGETTTPFFRWQVNRIGSWQDIPLAEEGTTYSGIEAATLNVLDPDISYNNYRYRVRVSGICTPAVTSGDATLIVETRPEVTIDPVDTDVCEDGDVFFTVQAGATKEPEYFWEYSDDSGASWDDAALLGSVAVSDNDTLVLTAVPSGYDGHLFRATITGKCPAVAPPVWSASALLTVYDKPEISTHPLDVTACEQDTVLFTVDPGVTTAPAFVWQYYNGSTWLQVPGTIYEGVNNDSLFVNGISSALNGARYRVIVSGTCSPDSISEEAVLTVEERPEVLGIPLDQTICEGDDVSFGISTGVTTSPVIVWQYSDDSGATWDDAVALPAFGGADTDVDTLDLTAVPSTYNGHWFRAIVGNGCGPEDTSMVAVLTVMNRPLIASEPVDALTCEGIPTSFGIDAGITSDPAYTWEVDNGVSGWGPAIGAQYGGTGTDTLRLLNPNSSMNGYQYRVVLSGYCTPNDTSDVVTLTVTENAEVTIHPLDASICETGDTLFYASPGVTTNPIFQWKVDPNTGTYVNVNDIAGLYSGATDSVLVITGAPFSMDGYQYKLEVTGDCGVPVESNPALLEVWKAPEITVQPSDTTTCELNNVKFTVNAGLTDFPAYQWYEDDGTSGMQPLTDGGGYIGTNSATLQIFGVDSAMTGYQYQVEISNQCDVITSDPKTLTVQSAPQIWIQPSDSTICEGGDAAFSVNATGTNLVYSWYVDDGSSADSIVNGGPYSGQGTATLQITGADRTYDRYRYFVRIEGTCQPWVQSDIAFLYVGTPPEISIQPVNDTICENSTAQFEVTATGDGLSYQWEERPDGGIFSPLSDGGYYIGTGQRTLSIFNVQRTYDNYEYRVRITGTCAPDALSDEVALTVKTAPVITVQPSDTTVCHTDEALFGITAEGSDLQYTWRVNTGGGFVDIVPAYPDYGDYSGADSDTLRKLSALDTENGYRYQVRVEGYCAPSRTSAEAIMNVNSLPEVTDPVDKQVCEDGSTFFSATATGPDLLYQWMVSAGGTGPWVPVVDDDTTYSGAKTDMLTINNATTGMNANLYRLDVSSSCSPVSSGEAELTVWENPTADIIGDDADLIICGGDELQLDGNPDGGSLVYTSHQWTGDVIPLGGVTNQQTATFMTNVKSNYTLNYTVTDDNGCKGTDTKVVENYRPVAGFTSNAVPACGNLTVDFTNTSTDDAVSFNWDFDNGFSSTDKDPIQAFDNFDPSGLVAYYNVTLTATDAQGCTDDAGGIVTIYPKVNPVITATPTSGCQPLNVLLETRSGAMDYVWDFGDGDFVTGVFSTYHDYQNLTTSQQTFETVVTTTSAYGCVASDTVEITVDPIPQPAFTIAPNNDTIPVSGVQTATLTNTTLTGPWEYTWDFGDGSAQYETTSKAPITHDYTSAGTYRVILYARTNDCLDSLPQTLTILPRAPVASFTSITEGCHPLEVTFTNTSQYADSYLWQFGDGSVSNTDSSQVTHTFYQPGDYTVKLLATGPGGSDQTSGVINVRPTPQVFFNYAPDSVFVNDKPVRFFNLTAYGEEYEWNFGDYDELTGEEDPDNTSTEADPLHIYMYEGWKDVLLVASNEYCEDSLFIPFAVKVIPAGEIRFPTVFRPGDSPTGGDTRNLNDPQAKNSVFFPGVNKQVLEYNLYIYTRWGQLVFESNDINIGWDGYIDGTKAAQGVYIWKVTGIYSNGAPFSLAGDVTLVWQ